MLRTVLARTGVLLIVACTSATTNGGATVAVAQSPHVVEFWAGRNLGAVDLSTGSGIPEWAPRGGA